jgi:hypothetical protein
MLLAIIGAAVRDRLVRVEGGSTPFYGATGNNRPTAGARAHGFTGSKRPVAAWRNLTPMFRISLRRVL